MQLKLRFMKWLACALIAAPLAALAHGDDDRDRGRDDDRGLSERAMRDLQRAGMDKYVGQFRPAVSEAADGGWTKHTFDPANGNGPICIVGSPYTAFTKPADPEKVLVYLNGGGACWQNFYFCTPTSDTNPPPPTGIFAPVGATPAGAVENPFADYSVVYGSYCDGSVFTGDNTVVDKAFPVGIRHHRGLRNATAVMDLAKATFPNAKKVVVAGSSAGGLGAAAFAPFLARFVFGNDSRLSVFNDAGPIFGNLAETVAVDARAKDWAWGQFLPKSCKDCSDQGHIARLVNWRLKNDRTIREAFYITDADTTLRFFLNVPTQAQFRALVLETTDPLVAASPRFKRFIRSGTGLHTSLRLPIFYTAAIGDVNERDWTEDFLRNKRGWVDAVEGLIPSP